MNAFRVTLLIETPDSCDERDITELVRGIPSYDVNFEHDVFSVENVIQVRSND
jgi:hypothetical protein